MLYALVPFPLGRLGADVLGGLYESYVDDIDRDRLGQFYTPRAVVRFMLDRAGFAGPEGVFRLEGDRRHERQLFDFATGSGGFLVEAARRVVDDGGLDPHDPHDLQDGLRSIVRGFHGCEISPFPYYLTEVNLLLQVSRLLGRLHELGQDPPPFTLGVVHVDSLSARPGPDSSLSGIDPSLRADSALLASNERYGIVPLDTMKELPYAEIRRDGVFDLVIGNPPYVAETGNKVLFERLRRLPGWRDLYRGKSDYLYYFLAMAAEKLAPGGRMCVITPAGWMNAGNADWLRERLAGSLRLDELYLFGSMRLFATEAVEQDVRAGATPPTVESAILLATRAEVPTDHKLRVVLLEDEVEASIAITGKADARVPPRDRLLSTMATRIAGRTGRKDGILVHDIPQSRLRSKQPWPIKHAARDTAARVVAHLQAQLDARRSPVERLIERWVVAQGVQTGADAYTQRIKRRLGGSERSALAANGVGIGDPILELPPGTEQKPPWRDHPEVLARSVEPRAILYGALDEADYTHLVWLGRADQEVAGVVSALERFRPLLATRADFVANPDRRWWETHRTRDKQLLRGPKVIALYRTDRGRFALDETGDWQPSIKTTLAMPREDHLSVAYLCGVLNSELLDLWYAIRGKTPRDVWRNYEPKPMNEMPYRHVPTPDGWTPGPAVGRLADALSERDATAAVAAADAVRVEVGTPQGDADARTAIEHLVRAIAANRRALLPLRSVAMELRRAVKNPWRTQGVTVERAGVLGELHESELRSIRLDPALRLVVVSDGVLGRPHLETDLEGISLRFRHSRKVTATVDGPPERLALLLQTLPTNGRMVGDDLRAARVPVDLADFEAAVDRRQTEVQQLLDDGRMLVEAVERLVCALYAVPDALTERIVTSAVARAGITGADDE